MFDAIEMEKPDAASTKEMAAMKFLLNVAVPAVEPRLLKPNLWLSNKSTLLSFLGDSYQYDVAMAILFVLRYSDTYNVLYNMGIVDEEGVPKDLGGGKPVKPAKKKRKKMKKKSDGQTQEDEYYSCCKWVKRAMSAPDFATRMAAWDRLCCSDRGVSALTNTTAATRVNTCPQHLRGLLDEETGGLARTFLTDAGMGDLWAICTDSSSSGSPTSSDNSERPFTQQSPPALGTVTQQYEA